MACAQNLTHNLTHESEQPLTSCEYEAHAFSPMPGINPNGMFTISPAHTAEVKPWSYMLLHGSQNHEVSEKCLPTRLGTSSRS
eukprot:6118668-Amphidinium_carterae.1